jgi:hypothetical protein
MGRLGGVFLSGGLVIRIVTGSGTLDSGRVDGIDIH